ncbi:MAG: zf-HC2 domain-containing protein [Candidatus Omnitrophica bacterium]|nr:zf-HC2 domain-containing protein [Candidatus Omnitrophota bacterium]
MGDMMIRRADSNVCRRIEPQLSALVAGELPEDTATAVRTHLGECPRCQETLAALETLGTKLTLLKETPIPPVPRSLFAGLRVFPWWLIRLASLRRWLLAASGLMGLWLLTLGLLQWAGPLPVSLSANASQQASPNLPAGTTLLAKPGEAVSLRLPHGTLTLQGPGALVIRAAALGKLRHDPRLDLSLPSGTLEIKLDAQGPPHDLTLTTPQVLLRLAGTWIFVGTSAVETKVAVFEGEAKLTTVAAHKTYRLTPGQLAQVQAGWLSLHQIPLDEWLRVKGLLTANNPSSPATSPAPSQPLRREGSANQPPSQ